MQELWQTGRLRRFGMPEGDFSRKDAKTQRRKGGQMLRARLCVFFGPLREPVTAQAVQVYQSRARD